MEVMFVLPVLLLLAAVPICETGRVLVFPVDGSHWLNMQILVEALHSRGHNITVLRSSTSWYVKEHSPFYTSITIQQRHHESIESQEFMTAFLKRSIEIQRNKGSPFAFIAFFKNFFNCMELNHMAIGNLANNIFENKTVMQQLQEAQYDVVLTDPIFPLGVILAHYLKLPLVLNVRWLPIGEAHFALAPSPLSYIPQVLSHYSDKMSFWQRLGNVFYQTVFSYMYKFIVYPQYRGVLERYFGPDVDLLTLIQGADIWLMRMDFVFEFPRPTMPNAVYMGGLQCRNPNPLPPELTDFVQSSGEHGIVIMSLGTLLGELDPETSEIIASAFARLPQKVIWRHLGDQPSTLGNNTLLVKWLPQADLLGHPKTRAFVTHGGTNGLYEAICHGVPVLGLPLIFDQIDNMVRLEARGAAKALDVTNLDVESLTQALNDILDNTQPYRENMQRLSRLHRDRPIKPLDNAIFWIEFVIRHKGASHLRTESYRMPWYEYHNLDVIMFLLGCAMTFFVLIWFSCKFVWRAIKKNQKSKLE
ncbi:UDP-glucuronosyltransferase 1-2-like isoform X2 [Chanos chanos]|uniref:UDP-glucuronosyltransferase n=1 Tax=Chanos chanos TaxID=29144 RepID=A0A6J2UWX0_CHACN|nr:UDP-glucuronosyltransferase 1-2-like isoform X2 [Chanos chanos]